jgi:hypothetical protein
MSLQCDISLTYTGMSKAGSSKTLLKAYGQDRFLPYLEPLLKIVTLV